MRESKYKLWDKDDKEWKIIRSIGLDEDGSIFYIQCWDEYETDTDLLYFIDDLGIRFELVEFTGLTDKNGDDIYEGDIVEYYDHTRDEYVTSPVEWNAPMFVVDSGLLFFRSKGADMKFSGEVIGNIYQHNHLLKGNG